MTWRPALRVGSGPVARRPVAGWRYGVAQVRAEWTLRVGRDIVGRDADASGRTTLSSSQNLRLARNGEPARPVRVLPTVSHPTPLRPLKFLSESALPTEVAAGLLVSDHLSETVCRRVSPRPPFHLVSSARTFRSCRRKADRSESTSYPRRPLWQACGARVHPSRFASR
jgi:hypothetical protein